MILLGYCPNCGLGLYDDDRIADDEEYIYCENCDEDWNVNELKDDEIG